MKKVDRLLQQIIVDADNDGEQLWAFRHAFQEQIQLPCDALALGEPVQVTQFDFDGNERRGLTATCRREDGTDHIIAACDVVVRSDAEAATCMACISEMDGTAAAPAGQARKSPAAAHFLRAHPRPAC